MPAGSSSGDPFSSRLLSEHPVGTNEVARVAVRVALEVVLVLPLGLPERARLRHLRHHLPWPATRRVDLGDGLLRDAALLAVEVEDRGAVARPDVVALAVPRCWVVDPKEELEQPAVRGLLGVENDLDRLGMPFVIAVRGARNVASAVAHLCREDSGLPPK